MTTHTKTYKILINYKMNSPKILHYKAEKFTKIRIKTNILLKKTVNKNKLNKISNMNKSKRKMKNRTNNKEAVTLKLKMSNRNY